MPTLTVTKSYSDGNALTEAQLDAAKSSIETFVNTTKLDADNLQDGAATAAKLASSAITTAKIAADAVTSAKLSSSASVDADRAVGTNHIKDSAVTAAKIASNAVTLAKRAGANYQQSSSCASYTTTSASFTDVTNLSVSFTPSASGQLIAVALTPTTSGGSYNLDSTSALGKLRFLADGNSMGEHWLTVANTADKLSSNFLGFYTSTGSSAITIKCQVTISGGATFSLSNYTLIAFELW